MQHKDLINGLMQLNPEGGHFRHDPKTGWPIQTPEIKDELHIWFEDDLTFYNNKVVEVEKYIDHYGTDINKVTFYTDHKNLHKRYPDLNWVWYPKWLRVHTINANIHQEELKQNFHFNDKGKHFLCLNRNIRKHRDIVCRRIMKDYQHNSLWTYHARGIGSPCEGDWSLKQYNTEPMWGEVDLDNINEISSHKDMLRNTKNLLLAKKMYNETSFSLVTETRANLPFDFVTEKTMQCFVALHPALYVSNKNHVALLRDWGFDVFDDVFDHSYDDEDDGARINSLFEKNHEILSNGFPLDETIKTRLEKNRTHYFTDFIKNLPDLD